MKTRCLIPLCLVAAAAGCVTSSPTGAPGLTGKLGDTGRAISGQFSTVGSAVTGAYGKTKSMLVSSFTPTPTADPNDPVSLSQKPPVISAELFVLQGQAMEARGDLTGAAGNYDKALQADAQNHTAMLAHARLATRRSDTAAALNWYAQAAEVDPTQTAAYVESAKLYMAAGDHASAKGQLQKAINLKPSDRDARVQMATLLIDQNQSSEALTELLQVDPPAMANYQMAYVYAGRKNLPAAQQHLQAALTIDPNLAPARELAAQLNASNMAQQAYGSYQQATAAYQGAAQAYQGASQMVNQAGQVYQQATAVMSTAPTASAPPTTYR